MHHNEYMVKVKLSGTILFVVRLVSLGAILLAQCTPASPPSEAGYYSESELTERGLRLKQIDETHSIVCGNDASCICLEPLACEGRGDCPSFDENIAIFGKALDGGNEDRTVGCDRAETGRCGEFRYFLFEGDIHRFEMRWFDASGRLVGQRNSTDYGEYCSGFTSTTWRGKIPRCTETTRTAMLCGKEGKPVLTPIADVEHSVAGMRASPTAGERQPMPDLFCGQRLKDGTDSLTCERSEVTSLAPLAGKKRLKKLELKGSGVGDLTPLAGFDALEELDLEATAVKDLAPLARVPKLKKLHLNGTKVRSLAPLAGLKHLELLDLEGTPVRDEDLAPLRRVGSLKSLVLTRTKVGSAVPIAACASVTELSIAETSIDDIAPLASLDLTSLDLSDTKVTDLGPLAAMKRLEWLLLMKTRATDLSPLARLKRLTNLYLDESGLTTLPSLGGLTSLTNLSLSKTKVRDLTPVASLSALENLSILGTKVTDVRPLARMKRLKYLNAKETSVSQAQCEALEKAIPNLQVDR